MRLSVFWQKVIFPPFFMKTRIAMFDGSYVEVARDLKAVNDLLVVAYEIKENVLFYHAKFCSPHWEVEDVKIAISPEKIIALIEI